MIPITIPLVTVVETAVKVADGESVIPPKEETNKETEDRIDKEALSWPPKQDESNTEHE